MRSCPRIMPGCSSRISREASTWPSYSSPWLPAITSTVGPLPFFSEAIGIGSQPYADWCVECGSRRKPVCLPCAAKSTSLLIGLAKARDDLLANELDGAHGLRVRGFPGLHHEEHLVHADVGPEPQRLGDSLRVAANGHAALDQVIVGIGLDLLPDRVNAAAGGEAHRVDLCVVIAVVPARRRAGDPAPFGVVVMAAGDGERAGLVVDHAAGEVSGLRIGDRLAVGLYVGP